MSVYGSAAEVLFRAARPFLEKKYDEGNDQRFGYYSDDIPKNALWIHAVSVGEVQSAYPLLKEIRKENEQLPILLSTITKTGKSMSQRLMGDSVCRIYYPWDAPTILQRALDTLKPWAYVTVETEIWPEMLFQLSQRDIPAFLVNGRLSESSFKKYCRFKSFWSRVIRRYTAIMARTEAERERFIALGALPEKVCVTGDCKVDALIERKNSADLSELSAFFNHSDPVVLAGSTHEGEETFVFGAFQKLLDAYPSLRLIVAPRHPERAQALVQEAEALGLRGICLMSEPHSDWRVLIVDKIGVLFSLYGCAEAAFMGGSIAPKGGQNIMEPAIWGIPFCQGPDFRDFTEATEGLISAGLCRIVHTEQEIAQFFSAVLSASDRSVWKEGSRTFFERLGGASARSWQIIKGYMH